MGLTKKQYHVYQFIKDYFETYGHAPAQREIKEAFGLKSFGSVQRYLKYLKEAGYLKQEWNAKYGLTLLEKKPKEKKERKEGKKEGRKKAPPSSPLISIPLLGDIAAGPPLEIIEKSNEFISLPPEMLLPNHRHYALRVKGDSMIEDGILNGDLAIIRYQTTASSHDTIVAIIHGEATLKRYIKRKNQIELHPANSSMKPLILKNPFQNPQTSSPTNELENNLENNFENDFQEENSFFQIAGQLVGLIRTYR